VSLLIQRDSLARDLLIATIVAAVVGELAATYLGRARDWSRRPGDSVLETVLLHRRRDDGRVEDRWTKEILIGSLVGGLLAAYVVAVHVPSLRAEANDWWTLGAGVCVALVGIAVRSWAIWTLGRYFRREVTIEADQPLIRTGPYRWVRHPAYAGTVLTYAGIGIALGSWVSGAIVLVAALVGLIPRIRVEERALERNFGRDYAEYRLTTARLVPHVW
jgi:protein-S-isoprenylcysteine O-methyltransferase Ste14